MQVRQLKVTNFRGIASLDWSPALPFCCLIGPGDSSKSTILDAIEAALSSRWFAFTEADFIGGDTTKPIQIEVTVGELSNALKSDERFGLHIRGWTARGEIRDEPDDGDEPVLTVRLTVDATLEPAWEVYCERIEDTRTLSNRDRALFGVVRLAGEDARHLAWGQGSVLSRLTGDNEEASARLAVAYKSARDSAKLGEIEALMTAANAAQGYALGMGAYVEGDYTPGLELGRGGLSSGSIALHDAGVPLRLAGLGTRRLATLAIQKSAISEGAIVLVDEIEHGLEPHRIMGAISQLRRDQTAASQARRPLGQIILTTHSEVALGEAGAGALFVCRTSRPARMVEVVKPAAPDPIHALMRFNPRALFARRILVSEGMTEVGMLNGIREFWPPRHNGMPCEHKGASVADGNGGQTVPMALGLAGLGYTVAVFRDSDVPLPPESIASLAAAAIPIFEYGNMLDVEHALFSAANDAQVQRLLDYARQERGEGRVNDNLLPALDLSRETLAVTFDAWQLFTAHDGAELRNRLAGVFVARKWFKDQRIGRGLGPIAWDISVSNPTSPFAVTLAAAEAWLYA
ncbi:AAA family ATPase [Variovorax sp. LjRoot290]|uniref:ATP-dependent nuclease n=1 Tax=Variovorax sp. LjRoot290 TaxID=3342316 RepID=UPI003ECEB30C